MSMLCSVFFFFFNDTATTEIYTLSLHDALPILAGSQVIADEVGEMLRGKPYFESVVKLVGLKSPFASGSMAANLQPSEAENYIGFSAIFRPLDERDATSYELADALRQELSDYLEQRVAA